MMRIVLAFSLLLVTATPLRAQQPKPAGQQPPAPLYIVDGVIVGDPDAARAPAAAPDPIAAYLFPPELIMMHQGEIGLQESQRATIAGNVQQAQAKFLDLQWKMSAETERLGKLLQPPVTDEGQVLAQVDRILAIEREIKRAQLALLIRIKNTLTPPQQAQLAEFRKAQDQRGPHVRMF